MRRQVGLGNIMGRKKQESGAGVEKPKFRSGEPEVVDYTPFHNRAEGIPVYTGGVIPGESMLVVSMPPGQANSVSVIRSPRQNFVQIGPTQYPVSPDWADAFEAIIKADGKPVGISKLVRKPHETREKLPPAVNAILGNDGNNKGYYLKPEYRAQR
jgi:hypothetical protein